MTRRTNRTTSPVTPAVNEHDRMTYAGAGVDIDAGDRSVELIEHMMRRTHGPRVIGKHGAFAGMFRLDYNEKLFKRNYKDPVLIACTDGVGTKVKLAAEMGIYNTVGIDCVAMNVNDLIVQGGEPLFFLDYLGVNKVVPERIAQMVEGVARGCELAGCALLGGETAEMPDVYHEGDFDIAGFAVGVVELERAMNPLRVQVGDVVIGLASSGIHSNGYSLVRRILDRRKLKLSQKHEVLGGRTLGDVILEPTRIYAKSITKLLRGYRVKKVISGMAHITGGGLPGNLCRALPEKLDARIDTNAWEVPEIFNLLQKQGNVDAAEMFRVFNMGVGYTLIVRPSFTDSVLKQLTKQGEQAFVLGEIIKGQGEVQLV